MITSNIFQLVEIYLIFDEILFDVYSVLNGIDETNVLKKLNKKV